VRARVEITAVLRLARSHVGRVVKRGSASTRRGRDRPGAPSRRAGSARHHVLRQPQPGPPPPGPPARCPSRPGRREAECAFATSNAASRPRGGPMSSVSPRRRRPLRLRRRPDRRPRRRHASTSSSTSRRDRTGMPPPRSPSPCCATGMLSRLGMAYRPFPAGPITPVEGLQMTGRRISSPMRWRVGHDDPYALADDVLLPLEVVTSLGGGDRPATGTELERQRRRGERPATGWRRARGPGLQPPP
jgi:hypothetical protein